MQHYDLCSCIDFVRGKYPSIISFGINVSTLFMCPKIRNNICNFVIVFVSECIFNFFKRGFIRDKIIQDRKTNRILIESKGEPTDIELLSPNELRLVGGRERR